MSSHVFVRSRLITDAATLVAMENLDHGLGGSVEAGGARAGKIAHTPKIISIKGRWRSTVIQA